MFFVFAAVFLLFAAAFFFYLQRFFLFAAVCLFICSVSFICSSVSFYLQQRFFLFAAMAGLGHRSLTMKIHNRMNSVGMTLQIPTVCSHTDYTIQGGKKGKYELTHGQYLTTWGHDDEH